MGFFGTYLFEGGRWSDNDDPRVAAEPWLFLNIYDSDVATVMYGPSGPATGMAFLGITPRSYFDDDSASLPVDVELEASGLSAWWLLMNPGAGEVDRVAKHSDLLRYLVPDTAPYDMVNGAMGDSFGVGVGVEIKAVRFLAALGLPLPGDLGPDGARP